MHITIKLIIIALLLVVWLGASLSGLLKDHPACRPEDPPCS